MRKMSILQQILLSLILAGCATDPSVSEGEPTGEDPSGDDSVVEQRVEPSDELRLSARELFFLRYDQEEYQVAIRGGRIQQSQIPASQSPRQLVYRLDDAPLRLFARPNYPQQLALQMTSEQQQYYHGRLLRHFFVQESPLVQVDEALVWLRWLESFVYNAEILTKKEDALQFFQDPDRLLSNINPFFYINYDGKLFSVDYLTIQENQLWQKRISFTPTGEITRLQQDPLDLERRSGL
ncbi:hypothetical protein [Entomospira culicis]|uniref:DUF4292 domain-containing protein n=1 Tax=Entomospira culicis TaxID=2719989 RepID=A0A968GG97_9SPIO|nr:hypothetical protein [Entomospira culicis]NIZ19734.1 hypothetical protein [Entomospira culicis]NIZ69948.1 hypothetical protein [Entomospira culicis]WDI37053.1 hypothetical protein PVA46_06965 [Entomospira culicis]WDI38682.1 hypothetical protein PVA47_06975 [Entomospira culicis]